MDTRTEHRSASTATLVSEALRHVGSLFRSEIHLARAELSDNLDRAAAAVGMVVAAVVIALTALNVLAAALAAGIAEMGIDEGWAALIVGAIFGLIAWALLSKGLNDLKMARLAPSRTTANVRRDAEAMKGAYNGK